MAVRKGVLGKFRGGIRNETLRCSSPEKVRRVPVDTVEMCGQVAGGDEMLPALATETFLLLRGCPKNMPP
jgi:hypothetical protein